MGEKLTNPEARLALDQGVTAVAAVADLLRATADQRTLAYQMGKELGDWLTGWKQENLPGG